MAFNGHEFTIKTLNTAARLTENLLETTKTIDKKTYLKE
jgi:hypothetical protein